MAETGAAMAFCPSPNLFLGSGLFDFAAAKELGIRVSLGTDVGGGTNFSQLRTLSEAYKVTQLKGQKLAPLQALYLATLSGARALYLDDRIGNFVVGKEADFIVVDWQSTPLLARRMSAAEELVEKLFALIMLGDDRAIFATHIMGDVLIDVTQRNDSQAGIPPNPILEHNRKAARPILRTRGCFSKSTPCASHYSAGGVSPLRPRMLPRSA